MTLNPENVLEMPITNNINNHCITNDVNNDPVAFSSC